MVGDRLESTRLIVEIPQVIVHKGLEPDVVVGLSDADSLAGEDLAEIDLAALETELHLFKL